MSEETTEQLAEIEEQAEYTAATEYTPPEGWRVLAVGERLRAGDVWVNHEGESRPTKRVGERVNDERYIRPIEPEPQPQPQHNGLVRDVTHLLQESGVLDSAKAEQQIEELRCEVSYVQRLLGESRRRVTQLEELVSSLRTINEATEKTVRLAGQENTDLQHRLSVVADQWALQAGEISGLQTQLDAVKAELVTQAETSRRLRIELDAAQQVPQAVSDRFEEGWDAGTARAVETIAEWTEPFRTCGSERLAWMVMENLPQIMRSLTGLIPKD